MRISDWSSDVCSSDLIEQVIGDLVDDLVTDLEKRGLGVRAAVLRCERVDSREQLIMVGTARATRDARHLARLFKLRIDRIEPGLGIEAMRLAAPQVDALAPERAGEHTSELPSLMGHSSSLS